jgi:transcriptional regulator with XRE-family HTH domain
MTIGQRVKGLREMMKLSQSGLAKKAGVSQATVSDYENDEVREHRAHILMKLAAALETTTDYIVNGTGAATISDAETDKDRLVEAFDKLNAAERSAIIAAAQGMLYSKG